MSVLSRLPQIAPRLNLDFTKGSVHPSIIVTRAGPTLRTSQSSALEEVPANTPALTYVDGRCMGLQVYSGTTNYKLAYYPKSCSDEAMRAWVRS